MLYSLTFCRGTLRQEASSQCLFHCSVAGPFIGLFINTCGCRQTAIIGGLVNSLGWVLSAYAANVQTLFVTFGVAAGKHGLTCLVSVFCAFRG